MTVIKNKKKGDIKYPKHYGFIASLSDFYESLGDDLIKYLKERNVKNIKIGEAICIINTDDNYN